MSELVLVLMMFWNLENYFDPFNNHCTDDDDFTPQGAKHWTWRKFEKKRDDISKTIMLVKDEYGIWPAVIGLCEVENYLVLKQLVQNTPLARVGYKILISQSKDKRGINTAMLYNPDIYTNIKTRFVPIIDNGDTLQTRYILYSKGIINRLDTVNIFINHWPSKLQGEEESTKKRMLVSNILKQYTDSILVKNHKANIILMGDFNDNKDSSPIKNLKQFINLSQFTKLNKNIRGTYKFKANWEIIDHFIVSKNFIYDTIDAVNKDISTYKWIYTKLEGMTIFTHNFLLIPDKKYNGFMLNRTMLGPRYNGGVSDHLPIILKIYNETN